MKLARNNKTDDWLTPPALVRSLGTFDLDPCASKYQSQPLATNQYVLPDDGLLLPWHGRVWCNPPFSNMAPWINKFMLHGNGIMICPASPDVYWFRDAWKHATGIFFSKAASNSYLHVPMEAS